MWDNTLFCMGLVSSHLAICFSAVSYLHQQPHIFPRIIGCRHATLHILLSLLDVGINIAYMAFSHEVLLLQFCIVTSFNKLIQLFRIIGVIENENLQSLPSRDNHKHNIYRSFEAEYIISYKLQEISFIPG